ncbi:hypothetical protein U1Q18_009984, partial [Sarracenia purpurea var. burkii]
EVDMWHQRLGYINYVELNKITSRGLMKGIPKLENGKGLVCGAVKSENKSDALTIEIAA